MAYVADIRGDEHAQAERDLGDERSIARMHGMHVGGYADEAG